MFLSKHTDRVALVISLIAVCASFIVAQTVFENLPHTEDEISYLWQARVFASGHITVDSPRYAEHMFIPFVIDYHGQRFSKYPPGWPLALALGVRLGLTVWVNPILAGLSVWITYWLGKKYFDAKVGLLASVLTVTSPFFLMNSGSLLSSSFSLFLAGIFILTWLDLFPDDLNTRRPDWIALASGFSLGLLALTRPLTALGVAFPFGVHGIILLWRGDWGIRKRVLLVGLIAGITASLIFLWQYLVTGDPILNPYTLWWSFDKVGFGKGIGLTPGGHSLLQAYKDTRKMLIAGEKDLFGWDKFSWLFLPFGLWALRRNKRGWLLVSAVISLVIVYMSYWAQVTRFGPRYYYEGLYGLTLISAAGIIWLARGNKIRTLISAALVISLIGYNLFAYLPKRLNSMRGIYNITSAQLAPFKTSQASRLTPALVIVHLKDKTKYGNLLADWPQYGGLLILENPGLTSPFIFAVSHDSMTDQELSLAYPNRTIIYYYPDEPNNLFLEPRK